MPTKEDLKYFQSMPLDIKIALTKSRIREWVREYGTNGVYVSFSGGKDSTVLLHIVRSMYPDIEAVFVDTGLEYPEIRQFVNTFDNVTILRPEMRFDEVIKKYGYPIISKEISRTVQYAKKGAKYALAELNGERRYCNGKLSQFNYPKYKSLLDVDFNISPQCCYIMKKAPSKQFEKEYGKFPILATMADESKLRTQWWLKNGCNAFESKRPSSAPLSFWTEQDVLKYIRQYNISIASVYGDIVYQEDPEQMRIDELIGDYRETESLTTTGCDRTGCMFCAFGCHREKEPSRFQRLKETHPRQYDYCINGGEYVDGIWQPNKEGLGLKHVFDTLNLLYGDGFIKY